MAKSIRNKLYFSSFLLGALVLLVVLNYVMNQKVLKWEQTYSGVVEVRGFFNSNLATEDISVGNRDKFPFLEERYKSVYNSCLNCHDSNPGGIFLVRLELLAELHDRKLAYRKLQVGIRGTLLELKTSVRYIHEHHIATLKNFIRRNIAREEAYPDSADEKQSEESAPELQIIEQVITIQYSIGKIIGSFHHFSDDSNSDRDIQKEFSNEMDIFYKAVNTFESFSLDAQDGLLVEELLYSGRIFEDTFSKLVEIREDEQQLVSSLQNSQVEISEAVTHVVNLVKSDVGKVRRQLVLFNYAALLFIIFWVLVVLYQGIPLIKSLAFLTSETKKISSDYSYRIVTDSGYDQEFLTLANALNTMAGNLHERIQSLNDEIARRTRAERETLAAEEKLQRAQKMEVVGLMASGVAHDLNNILTGITGYPDILLFKLPQDSELRKPVEEIRESGMRAAAVVADLLTIARGVASIREPANIDVLITEYLDSPEHRSLLQRFPQVECYHHKKEKLPGIMCSIIHIRKCIMNLIANSCEAIATSGKIDISTEIFTPDKQWLKNHELTDTDYVKISVCDNGPGIAKENIKHIFEPFYTKKVMGQSGTGLGLALVWNTVHEHDGIITVASTANGTSFDLYFPVSVSDIAQIKMEEDSGSRGNGETVLIVDDEAQLREIATHMLELLEYHPVAVESGEKAIHYMQDNHADLIILDMLMPPGINGRQTYEQILSFRPGQKAIVCSGFSESNDVKATLQMGAALFLKKPFSMDDLGLAVVDALQADSGTDDNAKPEHHG